MFGSHELGAGLCVAVLSVCQHISNLDHACLCGLSAHHQFRCCIAPALLSEARESNSSGAARRDVTGKLSWDISVGLSVWDDQSWFASTSPNQESGLALSSTLPCFVVKSSLSLCILDTAVTSACAKMLQRASCGSASPSPSAFSSASTSEHQLLPLRSKPRVGPIVRSDKAIPSLPRPHNCSSRPQLRQAHQTAVQAASSAVAMPGSKSACNLKLETNGSGLQRLKYQREGWQYWNWDDTTGRHRIHYISSGLDNKGPTVQHRCQL